MRHGRRGRSGGSFEYPSSGEDSFVAVVVTKLTGALLFILILVMGIMALIPRARFESASPPIDAARTVPLAVATRDPLPEAIAGRPYRLTLAHRGGVGGATVWELVGPLPEGLSFDASTATIVGTPTTATETPAPLMLTVADAQESAQARVNLSVLKAESASVWTKLPPPKRPPAPLTAWLEHGFGFLLIVLITALGWNLLRNLEQWRLSRDDALDLDLDRLATRYRRLRLIVAAFGLTTAAALAGWLMLG